MNIGIVTSGFLPLPAVKGGAVEGIIENLMKQNEKRENISFTIFSIYNEKAEKMSKVYKNTKFKYIKSKKFFEKLDEIIFFVSDKILKMEHSYKFKYIFQRLYYLWKVSALIKKSDYDKILLENHPTQYLTLKWNNNYKKYDGRYFYHCHNEFPGTFGCKKIIKNTNKIICVSEFISNSVEDYMKMPKNKFSVLRNCVDTKQFGKNISRDEEKGLRKKYGINEEEKILLFTGRITEEKGVKELIKSLVEVKYKNYKLLIVGASLFGLDFKTKYQLEVEDLIKDVKEHVIFTGYVDHEEIYKLYKLADIAVLPSIWNDPAPLTIIEALVSGLPIITTNSGGIPEYAKEKSAIILERDDNLICNLTKNIDELLIDDEKRKMMSENGKTVSKDLTLENFYNNFIDLLMEK